MAAPVDFEKLQAPHQVWLRSAIQVLTRTDRVLSGKGDLQVVISDRDLAPAWTDGLTISISDKGWIDMSNARLLGLNYHELAHVQYTPRWDPVKLSPLINAGIPQGLFNSMEDPRIEMLFTRLYHPAAEFFTRAVADLILNPAPGQSSEKIWFLIAGRRYLPAHLRAAARANWNFRDISADQVQDWADRYLLVDWSYDQGEADAIALLTEIRDALTTWTPSTTCVNTTRTQSEPVDDSREAAEVAQAIEDGEGDEDGAGDEMDTDGGPDSDLDQEIADQESEDGQAGDDTDQADADTDQADADADADTDQATADSEGEGGQSQQSPADSQQGGAESSDEGDEEADPLPDLKEAAAKTLSDIAPQIQAQADDFDELVLLEQARDFVDIGASFTRHFNMVPVTPVAQALSYDLHRVLAELAFETDPGWERYRDRGRLNPRRFLMRKDQNSIENIFDEWNPGREDALDLQVAILLDCSGSMASWPLNHNPGHGSSPAQDAAQAAWALKRALDMHGLECAVLGFNARARTFYRSSDEADPHWMPAALASDNTNPGEALVEVGSAFVKKAHRRRILVVLSDGAFSSQIRVGDRQVSPRTLVESIDAEVRILLNIGGDRDPGGFDIVAQVPSPDELVSVVRDTIVVGAREMLAE